MKYSEHQNVYMDRHDIVVVARTSSVAAASFLFGMLSISMDMLFPQGIYLFSVLGLAGGISIPLIAGAFKLKFKYTWAITCINASIGTAMLATGYIWLLSGFLLCLSIPAVVITSFAQTLEEAIVPARWRRELAALCIAACFVVLGRAIKIAPFATWQSLFGLVILFLAVPFVLAVKIKDDGKELQASWMVENPPRDRIGTSTVSYLGLGLAMSCMSGIVAFVPGFLGDMAWIDPNLMLPGMPRSVIIRPWAPWDTLMICAIGILVVILVMWILVKRSGKILIASMVLLGGYIATWIAAWSTATIPLFVWSLIGFPLYLGALAGLILAILRLFQPPRVETLQDGQRSTIVAIASRAWVIVVPFLATSVMGLNIRYFFSSDMESVSWMVAIPVITGIAIFATVGTISYIKTKHVKVPIFSFINKTETTRKNAWNAVLITILVFGALYTAEYTNYHAPLATRMQGLYMWGGVIGSWPSDVEEKVTHATVFSLDLNTTNGAVSSTWSPANNTPYHALGIKVMPTVFLAYTDLYRMLKNQGGMLDTFITTLKSTLEATGVDGVSIDFEMLVNPPAMPPVIPEDWIHAWERIAGEACHAGGYHFLLGVYWDIGAGFSRDQVNRYFNAIDIHVQNMYETHHQTGTQGSTTVIESSIESITAIYALLDNKSLMAKIMPGLPVYNYIWIDGQRGSLDESQLVPGGSSWPFLPYNFLQQLAINNNATFRWDPFSGATYSRFQMTLQDNQTVTVVAYLEDTAQLARSMHVMEGYGIDGIMLWPANQPVPPGFIDALY